MNTASEREFDVVVYPEAINSYTSQIYAGLYDLASQGVISLRYASRLSDRHQPVDTYGHCLWLDIFNHSSRQKQTVLFDMIDGCGFRHLKDMDRADVIIKRSFDPDVVLGHSRDVRARIHPYGLHYACGSRKEGLGWQLQQQIAHHSIHGKWQQPLHSFSKVCWKCYQLQSRKINTASRFSKHVLFADSFEGRPKDAVEKKIFFRTRIYADSQAQGAARSGKLGPVNESRIAIIRMLKAHFGKRFVGGLRRSPLVEKQYPDCLFPADLDVQRHIALSKNFLINVNTVGLHSSTGWKLPEIIAAARCAVSEAPRYELPRELTSGEHYLSFSNPTECVEACEKLLDDPELAGHIREKAFEYYQANVKPAAIVYNSLHCSFI